MKPFKTLVIVKYPLERVWHTMRDELPAIIPLLDDIEAMTMLERADREDGTVYLVNHWQARPQLPALLANQIAPEMMSWIDRAEWRPADHSCHWRLEPKFLPELSHCSGLTHYQPALGGRGTRIIFEGTLDLNTSAQTSGPTFATGALLSGVETFATSLIPKNFRKLAEAVERFLDG